MMLADKNEKNRSTKLVKARIIDEDGDLKFGLIEVPLSDKRPEFNPNSETLSAGKNEALAGNPLKDK
jgi:hypothetical protein